MVQSEYTIEQQDTLISSSLPKIHELQKLYTLSSDMSLETILFVEKYNLRHIYIKEGEKKRKIDLKHRINK